MLYANKIVVDKGPGSFLEVRKILPMLVNSSQDHPSFHVIAMSLPGYGFSEAPKKRGFNLKHYAEVSFFVPPDVTDLVIILS
jgi:hypothetical protein